MMHRLGTMIEKEEGICATNLANKTTPVRALS